jgi:hypothetical protein
MHVQVIISPEPVTRDAILGNISAALLPGAHLLLVVPAVRSAQLLTLTLTLTLSLTLTLTPTLTRCARRSSASGRGACGLPSGEGAG